MNDARPATHLSSTHAPIEPLGDDRAEISWRGFFTCLMTAFVFLLALAAVVIVLTNPYGNLPNTIFKNHTIVQGNQRFQYPSIARSGKFDSVVIGTSTSGILRPPQLDKVLGGTFANLAMDSARAWEQTQIAQLFRHHNGPKANLIIGIDTVWCELDADAVRITERGFPGWMYDDDPWNDLPGMFNATTLEYSWKRILAAVGLVAPRVSDDGYKVFLPDESTYDIQKVRKEIIPWPPAAYTKPIALPEIANDLPVPPALAWLDSLLRLGWKNAALVFMPVHATAQPRRDTSAFRSEQSCKAHISSIADRHATPVIDFRITSSLTTDDTNYWDRLHYRVPVGDNVAEMMATALTTLEDDVSGRWRILNAPKAKPWR